VLVEVVVVDDEKVVDENGFLRTGGVGWFRAAIVFSLSSFLVSYIRMCCSVS
jgi:hypothetical protein